MEDQLQDQEAMSRPVPLIWDPPVGIVPRYANHIVLQQLDETFLLSFYAALPPMIIGTQEERQAQAQAVEAVHAECVAQVIITPQRLEQFLQVLVSGIQQLANLERTEE